MAKFATIWICIGLLVVVASLFFVWRERREYFEVKQNTTNLTNVSTSDPFQQKLLEVEQAYENLKLDLGKKYGERFIQQINESIEQVRRLGPMYERNKTNVEQANTIIRNLNVQHIETINSAIERESLQIPKIIRFSLSGASSPPPPPLPPPIIPLPTPPPTAPIIAPQPGNTIPPPPMPSLPSLPPPPPSRPPLPPPSPPPKPRNALTFSEYVQSISIGNFTDMNSPQSVFESLGMYIRKPSVLSSESCLGDLPRISKSPSEEQNRKQLALRFMNL